MSLGIYIQSEKLSSCLYLEETSSKSTIGKLRSNFLIIRNLDVSNYYSHIIRLESDF